MLLILIIYFKTNQIQIHCGQISGNWQEHSFDSSIVTEGHYDASFESEILPTGPTTTIDQGGMPPTGPTTTTSAITTMGGNGGVRQRPPPLAHSAKKSVFSVSGGLTSVDGDTQGGPRVPTTNTLMGPPRVPTTHTSPNKGKPSGLMLWKRVQNYVVVGGAFVSSATAGNGSNEQLQTTQAGDLRGVRVTSSIKN